MKDESEKFRLELEKFQHHCSARMKSGALHSFVELVRWYAKAEETPSGDQERKLFTAYCRCQILSCYAALHLQKAKQHPTSLDRTSLTERNSTMLACYSYSMILQLAPDLTAIPHNLWWSADCIFSELEAYHVLTSLLLNGEMKEEFFVLLSSGGIADLIKKSAAMFTSNSKFKIDELFGIFGKESCQGKTNLESVVYDSAIRYLMLYDTSTVALKRLIWLWLFNWDPGTERLLRNDEDVAFDKLPYAPEDFKNTNPENLTVMDVSVFMHLSAFAADSSKCRLEKMPFILSGNLPTKKAGEALWASFSAHVAGRKEQKDVERIEQFLRYIRLAQQPMLCRSLLHTVARMAYSKVDEMAMSSSREAKLRIVHYANAYWCAVEALANDEKRAEGESFCFTFLEKPFTSEENQNMLNESYFYRAKLLLHLGQPVEAERMLRKCTSPTAARLHQELCMRLADSFDGGDVSLERLHRKKHYQKLSNSISERLLTTTDGFDESLLSNQEMNLIDRATRQEFDFPKNEPPGSADFGSNPPAYIEHHDFRQRGCSCQETFERLFETNQEILLKFGCLLELLPGMFNASIKCITEQNKQMMLLFQELLKSDVLSKQKTEPQAGAFEQYLNMLLNYFPSQQVPVPQAQGTPVASQATQNYPWFSAPFAQAQMEQFPWLSQSVPYANTLSPQTVTTVPSLFPQTTSLAGWPNTFNFGTLSQPPPTTQVPLTAEHTAHTGKGLFPSPSQPVSARGNFTQPPAGAQAPHGISPLSENVGFASKAAFTGMPTVSHPTLGHPPAAEASITVSTASESKGPFSNLTTVGAVQPTVMPKGFPALAKPTTTTLTFSGIAAAATTSSLFGKTEPAKPKFDFGSLATSTTEQKEALPSSPWKFGLRPVEKEAAATKPPLLGGGSFGAPKGTTARLPDATASLTKPTEDVVDAAASHRPFGIGTTAPIIQPAVLSVPFGTGTPLFSFSTAKSDSPILRSSWPPTKSQEVPKEVSSGDQKLSTSAEAPGAADMKMGSCIPPTHFESLVIEEKGVKSIPVSSTVAEPILRPAEVTKQASESEESEHEADIHYEPAVPLPELVEVITGEEDEEIIFKERAKMFRYHKETKEYKECGIGDLKVLKHPLTNKYRMVMRRDLVHKICANQFLYADMVLKPLAKRENSYCWIGQDYSGDELVTTLFAVRFRNEETALKFKATVEKCTAELKRQGAAADSQEGVMPSSVQSVTASKQEEMPSGETQMRSSKELSPTVVAFSTGDEKGKVRAISPQPATFSFGKGVEGFNFSFGKPVTSNARVATGDTSGELFSPSQQSSLELDDSKPRSTALTATTRKASVSDDDKKSDEEENYEPDISVEPIVPLPDLIDVVTGEENEEVLFSERSRLFRLSGKTKEYKERGTGNLKLLKSPCTGRVRLVMRRDVILNVIANHWITAEMKLNPYKSTGNVYFWQCQNFFGEEGAAVETVAAKFKDVQTAERFHSLFMDAVEADRVRSQGKGKDINQNEGEGDGAVVEIRNGGSKPGLPEGSWICKCCAVPNDSTRARCVCCSGPKDAPPNEMPIPQPNGEKARGSSNHERSFTEPSISGKSYSQDGTSGAETSGSSTETASLSAALNSLAEAAYESFPMDSVLSPDLPENIYTRATDSNEGETINLYPRIRHILQLYGSLLKEDTAWADVLFKGNAGLVRQEEDSCLRYGNVMLKVERNLEKCPYGRVIALNEQMEVCCNHFIKQVVQCHQRDAREWSWSFFGDSSGHLITYVASFPTSDKLVEFLCAWKEAKGSTDAKLASSSSSQAISVLCGTFSERTTERYERLAELVHLTSDFFGYLLNDGCSGCRACDSFKEERSPDILIYDQPCLVYMVDKEVPCRMEVWYLDRKQCYWTRFIREESGELIHELYEAEPFSDLKEINYNNRRLGYNVDVDAGGFYLGISFPTGSAFDEFCHIFLDTSSDGHESV